MKAILKEQLSQELIQALDDLNQTSEEYLLIELHGKKFVVVKEEEYEQKLEIKNQSSSQNSIGNLRNFFRNSPLYGAELDLERDKSTSRETEL
jgi:hypothetical protein